MSDLLAYRIVRVEFTSDAVFEMVLETCRSEEVVATRFAEDRCFKMLWMTNFKVGAITATTAFAKFVF